MKRMKVLRIIARLNIGGPAQHVIFLSEGLNDARFQTLLVQGMPEASEGDMSYFVKGRNVRFKVVPQLQKPLNLINDLIAWGRIFQIILKEKPDIIHTHTAKAGSLGRTAAIFYNVFAKHKATLIHTFHGHVLKEYFGSLKTALFAFIERFLAHFTHRIIAVSESVRGDLLKLGIGNAEKVIVMPLGLELERFLGMEYAGEFSDMKNCFRIGIIGRLVPVKNHKMFLDSAKLFISRYPSIAVKFVIVGNGQLMGELENYAGRLGIADIVEFTGWLQDLEKVYLNLDIVCLTSLNEGTPVSIIEAMAAAKPVIATDVGGVKGLLCDDATCVVQPGEFHICKRGILVKSCDSAALAEGLNALVGDEGLRVEMGQRARDFVRDRFSKERLLSDMKKLYEEVAT